MVNDDLPSYLIIDRVFDKLLINLLLSLVSHDLLHLFQCVWKLIKDILEGLPVIFKGWNISLSNSVLRDERFLKDVLVVDHLPSFKVSTSGLIENNSIHNKVNVFNSVTDLRNDISFDEPFLLELFQVFRVKVIISVLKESVH